jgi:hypothetical protein
VLQDGSLFFCPCRITRLNKPPLVVQSQAPTHSAVCLAASTAMSTFARSGSQDRIWQTGGPRQAHGMMQITQQSSQYLHLQQQNQTGTKAFSSHSHQPSLNTELRAQVRREREATKKESKDMLLSGQTGRERSSSILSNQQHREEKRVSPKGAAKLTSGGDHRAPSQLNAPRHAHKTSTSAGSEYNSQIHRPLVQQAPALLERQSFDDVGSQRQPFGDLASRIPSPPKGDDTRVSPAGKQKIGEADIYAFTGRRLYADRIFRKILL